jgi:hypothetical protein
MNRPTDLSDRDLQILEAIGRHGFMSAGQIERSLFQGPRVSPVGARRRTQRVLGRLTAQRLLQRIGRRLGGARGGSTSYVYRLDHLGRQAVGLIGRGSFREPSERFVFHALAAAEVAVRLIEAERSGGLEQLSIEVEPATWRRFTAPSGIETLKPDLTVDLTTSDGWRRRWFIEIDRGTEHLPTVLTKCQAYERYWQSGAELTRSEIFPRVAWSVPDPPRAERLRTGIERARSISTDLHRIATTDHTISLLLSGEVPINQPKGGHL